MFAVVPLTGFLVSGGSWRAAWAYTKQWFKYVGMIAIAGLVLALVIGHSPEP